MLQIVKSESALEGAIQKSRSLAQVKGACAMTVDGFTYVESVVNGRVTVLDSKDFCRLIEKLSA